MDIHRCRFIPYQPQTINAVAFSHASNPKQKTPRELKLALARDSEGIELWSPARGEWVQEKIMRGSEGRTTEQIHWTQDLQIADDDEQPKIQPGKCRLFSSGGSSALTEWDLEKGVPKSHAESNASDIWCFAAQPQWNHNQIKNNQSEIQGAPSQLIAAGCAEGSIVLFSTADGELRFDRVITRPQARRSRCLSITWRDRNTVVAGFEENVIRVFDIRSKQLIRNMTLGKGRDGGNLAVWAVKCLPNGTIVSGDSSGELKIWDSQNFSLAQRLKTHDADVQSITTNYAGTLILSCGVDRRTVAYAPQASQPNVKTQRWQEIRHRRFHEHDVKTIASFESKTLSIAVSGGIDTVPVVVPLKNWNEEYHRSLPHLPRKPQMAVSRASRVILTWWGREMYFWQLPSRYGQPQERTATASDLAQQRLLGGIQLKGDEHLTSADISSSGDLAAAATTAGIKLFQLRKTVSSDGQTQIKSRQIDLPSAMAHQGASTVRFSQNGRWLLGVRLNSVLSLVKITSPSTPRDPPLVHDRVIKLDRRKRKLQSNRAASLGGYPTSISEVAFSSDSRILAVGDLAGSVDTWILEGHESDSSLSQKRPESASDTSEDSESSSDSDSDSDDETDSRVIQGQKWIRTLSGSQLPSLDSAILALAFKPSHSPPTNPAHIAGNEGLHATRHTPHPVSHEHPPSESGHLVAVTANHQIVIFDVLSCRLAEWSRRHPSSTLPPDFKLIKDRTMGVWLDTRPAQDIDRLWLYGANFVYMLDLAQDLAASKPHNKEQELVKVGKLGEHVLEVHPHHALVKANDNLSTSSKKRKRGMGAGDEMREEQKYSAQIRARTADGDVEMGLLSPPRSDDGEEDDEDDELSQLETPLEIEQGQPADKAQKKRSGPVTWCTFQYRSIYGACALQPETEETQSASSEVIIVERPTYDLQLTPRFTSQDWET